MVIVYQNDTTTPPRLHRTPTPHRAYSYPKGGFGHAELVKMMGYKLTRGKMRPLMNLVISNKTGAVATAVAATHAVVAKGGSAAALRTAADKMTGGSTPHHAQCLFLLTSLSFYAEGPDTQNSFGCSIRMYL